ncbi:MAG: PEP-CTERM sorting domain-containing protein [Planctomycetota bacterium]
MSVKSKKSARALMGTGAAITGLAFCGAAHGEIIAQFNFPGGANVANKLKPTITADNVDVSDVSFNSTTELSADSQFEIRVNGFASGETFGDNIVFSVTPLIDPGTSVQQALNIESFSILQTAFGAGQPDITFQLGITTDPTLQTFTLVDSETIEGPPGGTTTTIGGPVTGITGVTDELFFVVYGINAEQVSAVYRLDTFVVEGTLTPIPEPGSLLLVGLSGLTILGRRRRHA